MALRNTVTERRWPILIITPISVSNGIITCSDTDGLRAKQQITISNIGFPNQDYEVKRVLSKTQFQIGEEGSRPFLNFENPTNYSGGTVQVVEQERNGMDWSVISRSVYEEEPVVALRTILIDKWGYQIGSKVDQNGINRLAVDAFLVLPQDPIIYNIPIPLAGVETSQLLPDKTQRFLIKVRDAKSSFRLAFAAGFTNTNYIKVLQGCTYNSDEINPTGLTLYFQTAKAATVMEILVWLRP
jgi:hypothetical protein